MHGKTILIANEISTIVHYRHDVNLRLVVTYDESGQQNDDFREDWANKYPDQKAWSYFYNLYYGSTQLDKFILVSVDGGRARLPLPNNPYAGDFSVGRLEYKIAQIFDSLGTLDRYMKLSGLIVE